FIQFFFKEMKRKKAVKISKGRKKGRASGRQAAREETRAEEAVVELGDILTPEEEEIAEVLNSTNGERVDEALEGQELYDAHTSRTIREKAISKMAAEGDPEDDAIALGIFPKAAGLARKVHDSGTVADKFNSLVDGARTSGDLKTYKSALDRRCPTRWNSDFDCLNAHHLLKSPVEQLTATSYLKLAAFRLSDPQWDLLEEVADVLGVCSYSCSRN
ncbi:hypothetical protein B0H13DRAFT_1587522, partial [Mycena leptocephala]